MERAYHEMGHLLALPDPPTAVFVGSDEQSLGVYRALHDHRLPITGGHERGRLRRYAVCRMAHARLDHVRQPLREMGRVATKMLLRLIVGEPVDSVRVELATPLITRDSCGPPRQSRSAR
jgi:LacI family transcriptional regulator